MREAASFIASQSSSVTESALAFTIDVLHRTWRAWRNRSKLSALSDYDDHMLSDIGLSRDDVRWALDRPFLQDPSAELNRRTLRGRDCRWRCVQA